MKAAIDTVIKYISSTKVRMLDFVDRCCCRYTPVILSILMLITGTIDTLGKPINCMVPTEFSGAWTSYVHQYCYVTGTYVNDGKAKFYVDYYQWVPFILIIQAIAMRLPNFLWRFGQTKTDIDFEHIHVLVNKMRNEDGGKRVETIEQTANYIYKIAKHRGFNGVGNKTFNYYIGFKLLNMFVVGMMIWFLTAFVGNQNPFWGISLARQSWPNHDHSQFKNQPLIYFPRIAYCKYDMDFLGHSTGGMIRETRCTLGINMVNEKVFLFLYFWYYALLAMVIMHTIYFFRFMLSYIRVQCINNYLQLVNREILFDADRVPFDDSKVERFSNRVLGNDGFLFVRFLHQNVGKLIAMEVCSQLYYIATRDPENANVNVFAMPINNEVIRTTPMNTKGKATV